MTFWRARSPESHLSPLTYENKINTTYVRLTNILIVSCDAQEASVCITFVLVLVGYHLVCRWEKKKLCVKKHGSSLNLSFLNYPEKMDTTSHS